MATYIKYTLTIFVMALTLSAITSTSVNAEEFCFCIGPRSNGSNITAPRANGQCFRSQTGPICVSQVDPQDHREQDHRALRDQSHAPPS